MEIITQITTSDLIELAAVFVSLGIALTSFKSSKKQILFNERLVLYSKLAVVLEKLLNLDNLTRKEIECNYLELSSLIAASYFIASQSVYDKLNDFMTSIENEMNKEETLRDFSSTMLKIDSLVKVMKSELPKIDSNFKRNLSRKELV